MASSPQFTLDPISASVAISTANTNRDGTGTLGTAYTARSTAHGGKGARIDAITIQATSTTTAGMVRLFVDDGTARLVREIAVSALTPSGTVKAFTIPTTEGADVNGRLALGLILKPGDILKASTHNAEAFVVRVEGGEF